MMTGKRIFAVIPLTEGGFRRYNGMHQVTVGEFAVVKAKSAKWKCVTTMHVLHLSLAFHLFVFRAPTRQRNCATRDQLTHFEISLTYIQVWPI